MDMKLLTENWEAAKEALSDGLDSRMEKICRPLFDNARDIVLKETAAAGMTQAHDIAGFRRILIPIIRRIIPGTIATELVGVQPMKGPVDQIFSMRYIYAESMTTNVSPVGDVVAGDELFGNLKPITQFYSGGTNAAQTAGAGSPLVGDISGTAQGGGWPSALDALAGCNVGGSGSYIEGSGGRKVRLETVSQAVEAKTRRLQASWTTESMQDLSSQHGLNMEEELTRGLSAQIVQEIDNEIISDLLALAGTVAAFDGSLPNAPGYYSPNFVGDRFANLGAMINYVANVIGRKTRRASGNFMVASPMVVSALQSASKSVFAPAIQGSFKGPNDSELVGMFGKIKVYSYLWNQVDSTDVGGTGNDSILIGLKGGNGELDSGYFYAPYVPLLSTGTVLHPETFDPVMSLLTRYGKVSFTNTASSLGNSADYYGKINVSSLSFA